jgi:glycosyltransferase involved in cell wall biosynthesis
MKVATITHHWKESDGGGIRTYAVNVVYALKSKGVDVRVLFRDGVDPQEYKARRGKVTFILDCCRQLKKIQPEVVHSHNTWHCLLPGFIYKKLNGAKLVHTLHTEPERKLSYPTRAFYQYLLNSCDWVVVSSKGLEEKIVEVHNISLPRSATIFGGASAGAVTPEEVRQFRQKFELDGAFPIILVQAFTEFGLKAQGLKMTIESLKLLLEKYPRAALLATRNGRYIEELKLYADREGIGDHVVFTGDVSNPFVPLSVCDVFVFPWLGKSGLGLALLEAMVYGKPVITTDVGYGSEVVRDWENGLLAPPDPMGLAEKIDLLVRDSELAQELGWNAKRTIEEGFTWERTAERYLRCFSCGAGK